MYLSHSAVFPNIYNFSYMSPYTCIFSVSFCLTLTFSLHIQFIYIYIYITLHMNFYLSLSLSLSLSVSRTNAQVLLHRQIFMCTYAAQTYTHIHTLRDIHTTQKTTLGDRLYMCGKFQVHTQRKHTYTHASLHTYLAEIHRG